MVDFQNRKKVYILCGKEEYATIWEHLHEIINVQEEELIIPYDFMEYEKIDEKIEQQANGAINISLQNELNETYLNQWFNRKLSHFKLFATMATEIIIVKNGNCCGIEKKKKRQEINHCNNLKNKTIRVIDMKQLTHQKTLK